MKIPNPEEYSKLPNAEKYGFCARCGGAMSEYDAWHSQGSHHAECFRIVVDEIRLQDKWDRLKAMGMHILDDLDEYFDLVEPQKRVFDFSMYERKNGKWQKSETI